MQSTTSSIVEEWMELIELLPKANLEEFVDEIGKDRREGRGGGIRVACTSPPGVVLADS